MGTRSFQSFHWGKPVVLQSDHKPLIKLLSTEGVSSASARLARLSMRMKDYTYKILYVPAKDNLKADFLSRLPNPVEVCEEDPWIDYKVALVHDSGLSAIEHKDWIEKHSEDKVLLEIIKYMSEGWPKKETLLKECKAFWDIRSELSKENDIIFRGC